MKFEYLGLPVTTRLRSLPNGRWRLVIEYPEDPVTSRAVLGVLSQLYGPDGPAAKAQALR